jgi:tRNA-dihydrouridine synthase B
VPEPGLARQRDILLRHYESLIEHYGTHVGVRIARKHLGWYVAGLPDAAGFRKSVYRLEAPTEVRSRIATYYDALLERGAA